MTSLRRRLGLGLGLGLLSLVLVQWLAGWALLGWLGRVQINEQLRLDATNVLAATSIDGERPSVDQSRLGADYQRAFSGRYFRVIAGDGVVESDSLWDETLATPNGIATGQREDRISIGPGGNRIAVSHFGFEKAGRALIVSVATETLAVDAAIARFHRWHGAISLAFLAGLLLLQRRLVGDALAEVESLHKQVDDLGAGKRHRLSGEVPDELRPLVDTLNQSLESLTRRQQRTREALGNLAHALKTRVAMVGLLADNSALGPEFAERLRGETRAMRSIIDHELRRARLLGESQPGQAVRLQALIPGMRATLDLLHAPKTITFHSDVEPGLPHCIGDLEDITELLGNLLDNAWRHCRGEVWLCAFRTENELLLVIEDDGPGCGAEELQQLTRRGYRADERIGGSGLGLAISREIAEAYGGRLELDASTRSGLRVRVCLPASTRQPDT